MPFGQYIYGATLLILALELVLGRHRGIYRRSDWIVGIGCIVANTVTRPIAALLIAGAAALLLPQYRGALAGSNLLVSYLIVLTIVEFCFYWVHRWAHQAKGGRHDWLWKLHRTHHSGKFINVTTTIRINAFWPFVVPIPWVLGIATYLGLEMAAALTILTIYGWNLLTHSHFRWDDPIRRHRVFGPAFRALEHIIVSPGMHHTHHGYGKDGGNYRNHAVTFAFFDWMFGTLHIPEGRPWRYGVPGPNAHWAEEILFPLVRSGKDGRPHILPRFGKGRRAQPDATAA